MQVAKMAKMTWQAHNHAVPGCLDGGDGGEIEQTCLVLVEPQCCLALDLHLI